MQAIDEKKIAIVCNRLAGNGRAIAIAEKISGELFRRNISHKIFKEFWPGDFDGFTGIFVAGGDGTLNYFINRYPEIKIPIVIFKGGSGNDFHWLLYGDKGFDEQLEIALSAKPQPVDAGKCN
ncbi:MAG TPA: diacylglycerol kinase family protein, partial [Chitinophagaceae bacterium]|nr:diacylglycerol kinase family protein [Chitinophagaceae bacterium]